MNETLPKISIVTTLYNSAAYVNDFFRRMTPVVQKISSNYEFVFIDDGSPDNAAKLAQSLDGPVRVVRFSRNFGHHHAMMAGCRYAKGDYVFLIDSDLEEEPELLLQFWNEMKANPDIDAVYGVQKKRKGGWFERISGELFYRFFNYLSDIKVPQNLLTIRLMSRRYVDALLSHDEKSLFIAGLWANTGFGQKELEIIKKDKGSTTYRLSHKIDLIINSITSFSKKPLHIIFYLSLVILLGSFVYMGYIVYLKMIYPELVMGYPSIIVSIWFLGGLILFCVGIVGMYISKLFVEVKNRPLYIVKEITDKTL